MKVVVVGGGPVGLYAAAAAQLAGMDATVIEQREGVIDKACGEGLMPAALGALREIGVDPVGVEFGGIRYLDAEGRRQVRATLATAPGRGVQRTTLMAALLARTESVGVTSIHDRVIGIDQDATRVCLTLARGGGVEADVVLGCDGLSSGVRSAIGLGRVTTGPVRYGLRQHFSVRPWSDDIEVYWASRGEAYLTPVAPEIVGVALLGERGGTFNDRLADFPALVARLGGALPVGATLGAGPLRRRAAHPLRGRVLLVGDAAGYVDALTGEGLAIGFIGARAAVSAAASGNLDQYAADWSRITRRFRWSTEALLRATQWRGSRAALLPLAQRMPTVFSRAVTTMT
ncbi:MAG: FAD-dependent monooxygenase [Actinomycetia bacterium]|nr:FAD-dependent monooxygenase [Actinomycetes bacterium]